MGRPKGYSPKKLQREKILDPAAVENIRKKIMQSEEIHEVPESAVRSSTQIIQERQAEEQQENNEYDQDVGNKKVLPESELELNYFFTTPQWGDDTVNPELQNSLKKNRIVRIPKGQIFKGSDGKEYVSDGTAEEGKEKNYWSNLSFLTRDIRLANYNPKQYNYCAYYYGLGGAMLNEGFPEAASICIQLAAIEGEMSQGTGGFLRRIQQTLIRKDEVTTQERKDSVLNRRSKNDGF